MFTQEIQTFNEQIELPLLKAKKVELWIKREDKIHEFVSGNKFRKLKFNIQEAKKQNKNTILTFGGAFSNHIVATAVAGKISGIQTIGIIRGEELEDKFEQVIKENKTLYEAHINGMRFEFVSRATYKEKNEPSYISSLKEKYGNFYLIPEGGTNDLAIKGCEEILTTKDKKFKYICTAVGTGGTIAGIIRSKWSDQQILGFSALKGDFLNDEVVKYVEPKEGWEIISENHFGGYGKYNTDLIRFINDFYRETNVLLDPIYTGKMIYKILNRVKEGYFESGSKILAIHTGGLQGIHGFNTKLRKKNLDLIKLRQ